MFVLTYFLSQLRKMLILFIRSHHPIVKPGHCQQYDLACLYCSQQTNARDCIVGNVHILQQELMSKINNFVESKSKFVPTRSSAPKLFGKFGWQTRTLCHKKMEKAIAKLGSDRL